MNIRGWLKCGGYTSLCVLLLALFSISSSRAAPNFLLVVADDMGWTDLASFVSNNDTRNLDYLARRGMKFT